MFSNIVTWKIEGSEEYLHYYPTDLELMLEGYSSDNHVNFTMAAHGETPGPSIFRQMDNPINYISIRYARSVPLHELPEEIRAKDVQPWISFERFITKGNGRQMMMMLHDPGRYTETIEIAGVRDINIQLIYEMGEWFFSSVGSAPGRNELSLLEPFLKDRRDYTADRASSLSGGYLEVPRYVLLKIQGKL